jgi:hypothetical protein
MTDGRLRIGYILGDPGSPVFIPARAKKIASDLTRVQRSLPLALPTFGPDGYKSASQRARVGAESWGAENFFCPVCESPRLTRAAHNIAAILHPENHHLDEKIRQQLQELRDLGILKFVEPGFYRLLGPLAPPIPLVFRHREE